MADMDLEQGLELLERRAGLVQIAICAFLAFPPRTF
jgi:hypothetical protein